MNKTIKCFKIFELPGGDLTIQTTFDHLTTPQCKYLCDNAENTIKPALESLINLILHSLGVKEDHQALNALSSSAPTIEGIEQNDSNEFCLPIFITEVTLEKWNSTLGNFSADLCALALEVLRSFVNSTTTSTTAHTITTKSSSTMHNNTTKSTTTTNTNTPVSSTSAHTITTKSSSSGISFTTKSGK